MVGALEDNIDDNFEKISDDSWRMLLRMIGGSIGEWVIKVVII